MNMKEILVENARREAALAAPYDPITGEGALGERVPVARPCGKVLFLPKTLVDDPAFSPQMADGALERLRLRHDFDFWCARCVVVKDKLSGDDVPLRLNAPQRRVAAEMESMRLARMPIRLIMLKARQWGGSTLVQMYMAWIQMVHRRNWNSLICAHVKDTAAQIRGMYTKALDNYPAELADGDETPAFKPFERSTNIRIIAGRGCKVTVASAENQEAVRGGDYAMAHLTEAAFWPASNQKAPESFIRAVCGAIALQPYTLIAIESTANGVGNFFHTEWMRCRDGKGDKLAVFVPWYEIEIYRLPVADPEGLWQQLTPYERNLFAASPLVTLEKLCWYHRKSAEYSSHAQMCAEFPSTDIEAFADNALTVFSSADIEALRAGCRQPLRVDGPLKMWQEPVADARYVVAVDIGGRSAASDYSVIAVVRRPSPAFPLPEVVAQWRGHIDHFLLVGKCRDIARRYNTALLVIESNTLETEADGDAAPFMLDRLARSYPNLYYRTTAAPGEHSHTRRPGFHTNRATKSLIVNGLIEAVHNRAFIERDSEACNELATYQQLPNGSFAAAPGRHDDILMTRAMALHVIASGRSAIPAADCPQNVSW